MKKILFIFLISFFAVNIFAQSVTNLERDPSFKGIIIGAPIGKYSDILTFSHALQEKNIYRVNQNSYLSIFNIKMQDMIVVEKNGKVFAVQLTKTYPSDSSGATVFLSLIHI